MAAGTVGAGALLETVVRVAFRVRFGAETGLGVRARVGLMFGGAVVGFRHGAGAGVGVCIRVAVALGLDEVAGQHAGEHMGLCGQQGSTLQGGGAARLLPGCPSHLVASVHTVASGTLDVSVCTAEKH